MKEVIYVGKVEKVIAQFPEKVRARIASLLDTLRLGLTLHPKEFKYMPTIGQGVYELRVKTSLQYRVFYITKFEEAIYVLHAFTKKESRTSKRDIKIGIQRFKEVINQ